MDEDYLDPFDDCWGEEEDDNRMYWISRWRLLAIKKIFNLK
jgi:hypothetical protein